jgi:hypothetical protein
VAAILSGCSGGGGASETAPVVSLSGTVDSGYGAGGRIAVAKGDIAVDRAGNVFVGDLLITKFDASGRPAGDFVDGAPASAPQADVVVDSSGNVYSVYAGADGHFVLVKRDATGRPVDSFGQAGRVDLSAVRPFVSVGAVFVDGSGNVYVDGVWIPPLSARPVFHFIIKLDATGRQVTSFGAGTNASLEVPSILELQPARTRVDAAGNIFVAYSFIPGNAVVEKFDANGHPVTSFGADSTPTPCATARALSRPLAVARDAGGNIYVGGTCSWGSETRDRVFVVKLDANGSLVTTFGEGGIAADFFVANPVANPSGAGMSTALAGLQPAPAGGPDVAPAAAEDPCAGVAIVKLGADGRRADAFGSHGVASLALAIGVVMAVDSSARLYVGGLDQRTSCPTTSATPISYSVYRLNG